MTIRHTFLFISTLCCLCLTSKLEAADIHVPASAALHDALLQARDMLRLGKARHVTLHLEPATYRLTEPLVLHAEDNGITLDGHGATLSGAIRLKGWQQEGRLWVTEAPVINGLPLRIRQLWVNGRKALRASQFGRYKLERLLGFDAERHTITIPTPANIAQLQQAQGLEMLVHQRWAIAILRVKTLTPMGKQTLVTFQEPESRLEFAHPWPQPIINGEQGSSSFCLMNALCLVDEPGEWFQDAASGKIYYYPQPGERTDALDAEAPVLERLLTVEGTEGLPVSGVTIKDVNFAYCGWSRPTRKGHVTLQGGFALTDAYRLSTPGVPWCDRLDNQAWTERPDAAVRVEWGRQITFQNCSFSHLAATALDLAVGVKGVSVTECRFTDIGGTALMAGSFSEGGMEVHRPFRLAEGEAAYCDSLLILRNTISDAANEDWGAVGIGCGYVRNTSIIDNTLSNLNYSGICVGWGWTAHDTGMRNNLISGNHITNYAKMLYDVGGIYTLSYQPGSKIINNTIGEPAQAPYATNNRAFKLYLDDSSGGFTISGNHLKQTEIGTNHPGKIIYYETN